MKIPGGRAVRGAAVPAERAADAAGAADGRVSIGDQLPSVREVVAVTAVNPDTVLKAYRDLEREGHVRRPPGRARSCAQAAGSPARHARGLRHTLAAWVREARAAGLDDAAVGVAAAGRAAGG